MKKLKIVCLSSANKLLVQESEGRNLQLTIDGFTISSGNAPRIYFDQLFSSTIDCSLAKGNNALRYQNDQFFLEGIEQGVLVSNSKEIEDSKIYSKDQKGLLLEAKSSNKENGLKDYTVERKMLYKVCPRSLEIDAKIECLSKQILLRVASGEHADAFIPVKLKNINTFFECLSEASFVDFFLKNREAKVKLVKTFVNLDVKNIQIQAEFPKQLELWIIEQGWGTLKQKAFLNLSSQNLEDYLFAENKAKSSHNGIFKKPTQILSFIYAKNNFVGSIRDVMEGYVFEVCKKSNGEKMRVELSMTRCPIGDQAGAFACRQFARRQLIGQQVNVYLQKDTGLNIFGSIIRCSDSKDVEAMMLEKGFGYLRQEFTHSILSQNLAAKEKKAKEKAIGIYNKNVGTKRFEDLTQPNIKKQEFYIYRRMEILKSLDNVMEEGVMEAMIDPLIYRVCIESKNIVLKVKLEGLLGVNINPLLQQVQKIKQRTKELFDSKIKKRTLQVHISHYQKDNNLFIGTLCVVHSKSRATSIQHLLVSQALVYCDKESIADTSLVELENQVKAEGVNLWCPNLRKFEPINLLQIQKQNFIGKFSWVEDGETVCIQPVSNYETIEMIFSKLNDNKLERATHQTIVPGAVLVAPYFDDLYRAKVLSAKGKNFKVLFMDYGNKDVISKQNFYKLPIQLQFLQKQCLKAKLYMTRPLKNHEYIQKLRNHLIQGGQHSFKKEIGDYLSAYRQKEYINLQIIEKGFAKSNDTLVSPPLKESLRQIQESLRKNRVGVWEWSDSEESDRDSDNDW